MAAGGWFKRLASGLGRSSAKLGGGVAAIFGAGRIDGATLEELEELLIAGDLGVAAAARLTAALDRRISGRAVSAEAVAEALAEEIATVLEPVARPLEIDPANRPFVILVAGVNGTGKTTTMGKLAAQFRGDGKSVLLVAGDTFRAAAVEQLRVWGARADCPVLARDESGADPAGLAFDAVERARAENIDVVMIDTAGRLQNKSELMDELTKIVRVLRKIDPGAPHASVLVLDATTGQNAHNQVEVFQQAIDVSGLVITKLDGTARGGVAVALAERFGLPIYAVGVGEGIDDLRPFDATAFARALLGLDAGEGDAEG
jgi:fused signal recognition particle receptor